MALFFGVPHLSDKPTTAIVERHRYVLDWFERDKIELPLEKASYEFQYRFGPDWFLESRRYNEKTETWEDVIWPRLNSFNLANPAEALAALGDSVTKFTSISTGMRFNKALTELLERAEQIRKRQEASA